MTWLGPWTRRLLCVGLLTVVTGASCSRLGTGSTPAPQEGDVSPLPIETLNTPPLVDLSPTVPVVDPSDIPARASLFLECPVEGTLEMSFIVPPERDYEDFLPAMGDAPEIRGKSGVLINLYAGPAKIINLTGAPGEPRPDSFNDVVCVVLPPDPNALPPQGQAFVYYDISRDGFVMPPQAYVSYVVTTYLEFACRYSLPPCNPQRPAPSATS